MTTWRNNASPGAGGGGGGGGWGRVFIVCVRVSVICGGAHPGRK